YADAHMLAQHLADQGLLTAYQVEKVLEGEARGLVLGPYVLAEPIGSGSLGTVFRAVGKADRQPYAVKVLPLRSLWNVRLARKQAGAVAELTPHPAIVPFMDVGTALGKHYLVWPLVEGRSLESLVDRHGAMNWHEAVRVVRSLAEGLHVCHDRGLFHG